MKIRIFLLVLEFTQICYGCLVSNLTKDNEYPSCPFSVFRKKRALSEYTRWRSNEATKPQFIVKVDDEMIPTTIANQIMAINIQPEPKAVEKIIVGGAMIPTGRTIPATTEIPAEYTRFVPPTTERVAQLEDLYLAPAITPAASKGMTYQSPLPKLAAKHPQRDESPPAIPQFIPRTPSSVARQYAPITPVAFFPRAAPSHSPPLTPPTIPSYMIQTSTLNPFRTSPLPDETPSRTESISDIMRLFQPVVEETNQLESLFTLGDDDKQSDVPQRTPTTSHLFHTEPLTSETTSNLNEWDEMGRIPTKKTTLTTSLDSAYNMMYYNEDDNLVGTTKKKDQDFLNYDVRHRKNEEGNENLKKDPEINSNRIEYTVGDYDENTTTLDDFKIHNYKDQNSLGENRLDETISSNNTTAVSTMPEQQQEKLQKSVREKRRPVCNLLKLRKLNFQSPPTLPEIVLQLKKWSDESPIAKWIDITYDNYTTMENPIYLMKIDDPSTGQVVTAKQTVMIVAGIQGRDHHAVTAAMYVLYQLIEHSDAHADLLSKFRFWVIPVFNPDGYDYSMSFPQRRDWTKNLHQSWEVCRARESCRACETHGLLCTVRSCYGVNLDRNFEYQWIPTEELRAEHPCGELYAGTRQLSEAETRALTLYLHEQRTPLHTFIALKEGSLLGVMYPYSHTRKRRAFDHVYRQRASRAAAAAYSISGRPYVAGQTSEFLPLYAGGIEDWVDGHLGIDNTYTIMIYRPIDTKDPKLIMAQRVVHEAFAAVDTLLLQSLETHQAQVFRQVRAGAAARRAPAPLVLAALITLITS